jgi:hypothetical protein
MADPYIDNVSLLLHYDGTNGSTTFTDSSPTPKVVSAVGSTAISTAQSKFGGASAYFDGTGSYLSVAGSTDLAFGTGDFTVEFFVNINLARAYGFFYFTTGTAPNFLIATGSSGRTLRVFVSGSVIDLNGPTTLALNTWYHVAVTRSGSTVRVFLNGIQEESGTCSSDFTNTTAIIGEDLDPIDAYIDELRVTKGIARYTANFTPPTAAFDNAPEIVVGTADIFTQSTLTAIGLTSTNTAALNAVSILQATGIVPTIPVEPSAFTVGTNLDIPNEFTIGTNFLLASVDTVYATAYIVSTSILTAELQTDEDVGYANIRGTFRMDLPASGIYNIIWKDYVNTYAFVYY